MTMEVFRDVPKELVEEMLTRVPSTYLKGLGSTCKRWNRLFNGDRRFARNHSEKAAKQFLGLMLTRDLRICPIIGKFPCFEVKTELSLVDPHSEYPGAQFDVGAIFHCDGHLLCTSEDESRFVVWNPFTGFTRWFQPSYRGGWRGRRFALGYGKNKSYKILKYDYLLKHDSEIYEFSSDSWRVVDDIMPRGWALDFSNASVSLKGSTYWFGFAIDVTQKQSSVSLAKFDFSTEKCLLVPLPCQCKSVFEAACVSVVKEEKLSVMLQLEKTSKTEIWVSNKIDETTTQVVSWNKVLSLDLSPDLQLSELGTFLLDEEKKLVVISMNWMNLEDEAAAGTRSKEMIYIVGEDNEVTQVDFGIGENPKCQVGILNYVPSLVVPASPMMP